MLACCGAELIVVDHTHIPMDVQVNTRRVVNIGSVSIPVLPDLRARYSIIEADEEGYDIQPRCVAHDREAVIASLRRIRHPGAGFIVHHMRGEATP